MSPFIKSYYDKYLAGNLQPYEIAYRSCLSPKKIKVFDSYLGSLKDIVVSCNHCYNCLQSKRDEWCSRMCLHSYSYKYCYFVTLTYGSYDLNPFITHPFKEDWLKTFPIKDNVNKFHRYAWSPSILVHEHLTKFLKRLRIRLGFEISYAACGEYGSDYGRPHFHLIIWSNELITKSDIQLSWSYKCVQIDDTHVYIDNGKFDKYDNVKRFTFSFGRVDFDNLTLLGEMSPSVQSHKENSAFKCFRYVSKYVTKNFALESICEHAIKRLQFAFINNDIATYYDFENDSDKIVYSSVLTDRNINFNNKIYENVSFQKFKQLYSPFFVTSRKYSIGKQYALERMQDFKTGNFALPKFQGKSLKFPSYFMRLLQYEQFPLRFEKISFGSRSLNKGNLSYLYQQLILLREKQNLFFTLYDLSKNTCGCLEDDGFDYTLLREFFNNLVIKDSLNTYRYKLIKSENEYSFVGFQYSISARKYYFYDHYSVSDFLCYIIDLLNSYFDIMEVCNNDSQLKLFDITSSVRESAYHDRELNAKIIYDKFNKYKKTDLQ